MIEGKYNLHAATDGCWHYRAWLEDSDEPGRYIGCSASGCSSAPRWFGWNRSSCERGARRACRRLMRLHNRKEAGKHREGTYTMRFDGRQSYTDLQARIRELEAACDLEPMA